MRSLGGFGYHFRFFNEKLVLGVKREQYKAKALLTRGEVKMMADGRWQMADGRRKKNTDKCKYIGG
jgi:hypothetical protein